MKKLLLSIAVALTCLSAAAQVRVVGHRGCRFNTPAEPETPLYENTLAALKFAQGLGIYAAEFDVQLTSDGKPIVFHGPVVPGIKKDIHEITFDEARAAKLPGGNRMPTLEEYFKQAKKNPAMKIICEIKRQPTPEGETSLVEQTMALAAKMKMQDQIEYTSFSEWACAEIKRVDPSVKVIFIESGL
ncbi:MAG: glycerophosphodiester phosphodiesterase, partial [Bacteroidales bacterium]|nr:glycerophosphodiester phosphodiesterase [Bacteroidales bacterium]